MSKQQNGQKIITSHYYLINNSCISPSKVRQKKIKVRIPKSHANQIKVSQELKQNEDLESSDYFNLTGCGQAPYISSVNLHNDEIFTKFINYNAFNSTNENHPNKSKKKNNSIINIIVKK